MTLEEYNAAGKRLEELLRLHPDATVLLTAQLAKEAGWERP